MDRLYVSKPWTAAEELYLTANWLTKSAAEIGAVLGKTRNAVTGKANRLKLPQKGYSKHYPQFNGRKPL